MLVRQALFSPTFFVGLLVAFLGTSLLVCNDRAEAADKKQLMPRVSVDGNKLTTTIASPTRYYSEIGADKFSSEFMLFFGGITYPEKGPVLSLDYLVVYLKGATSRPPGVSYFTFDQQMDCGTKKFASVYTAYAADGNIATRSEVAPSEVSALIPAPFISWTTRCDRAAGKSLPPPPVLTPALYRTKYATSLDGALNLARDREVDIETATHLSNSGKYALYGDPDPRQGATFIDYSRLDPKATSREISWLFVSAGSGTGYVRSTWTVDCTAHTGTRKLVVFFDDTGSITRLIGAYDPLPLNQLWSIGSFLSDACNLDRPGWFDRTYLTVNDALAAGHATLAP